MPEENDNETIRSRVSFMICITGLIKARDINDRVKQLPLLQAEYETGLKQDWL